MGDPACWMAFVCADCGAFLGEGHEGPCPYCGSGDLTPTAVPPDPDEQDE